MKAMMHPLRKLFRTIALRGAPRLGNSLTLAACTLTIALMGCSQKSGKSTPKVVLPTNPESAKPEVQEVVSKLDSLVKQNSGKGKGVITGFLTGEGKSIAGGLLKQAGNAGGERRLLTRGEIPLSGATILIFDALKPTTAADTSLKTDSAGNYTCVLKEGKYFGFAVYLDLETFQLVTTSIPNMNPKADTIVKMDTAIAIEDVTAPTVAGVYDANTANENGIFLVGSVPDKNAKINLAFSEPMNRDAAKGVILGRIDTSNSSTSMVLADTVKDAKFSWNGDSKELTVTAASLALGAQYGIIIPVSLKDLAKNPLEKEYKATFRTVAAAELAAVKFAVVSTFPADKESIKPIQNPGVSFNRPVEVFSVLKGATIDPAVTGYWEVSGARAVFIHKEPLAVGKTYTVTMPKTVSDLAGAGLEAAHTFSFTGKDFEGAAKENTGREKDVALTVEGAFDAYLSGDIGRFAAAFHANFRLYDGDGSIQSKAQFLDMIRRDVGDRQSQSAGFAGPVFDNSAEACKDGNTRWKVAAEGGGDEIWVDAYVNPGQSPRAYDKDKAEIPRGDLAWDPTGPRFTYKSRKYGFGPDMSKFRGPVNMDAAKEDQRFMGDLLKQTSTVVLEPVKLEAKDEFKVDPAVTLSGDTAKLAVKMIEYRKYNRTNFGDIRMACEGKTVDTSFQILKFILVHDGSKWLVVSIVAPSDNMKREDFDRKVEAKDFQVKQILPITLVSPLKDNGMSADGMVAFRFKGPAHDSIGGYLVGIAEDPKFCFGRPPYGALIFVKASNQTGAEETFVLNSNGLPAGANAAMVMRRPHDLRLPGWERTLFEYTLKKLVNTDSGFGGVYQWKVIAIKDTSAVQFLAGGFSPERYYGESDFGPTRGYFACKGFPQGSAFAQLEQRQQQFVQNQPMADPMGGGFGDMDMDGIPDGMESKYKTDPKDRNSYPDFRVDTDGDGLADFLEAMLDKDGKDSLIDRKADDMGKKALITKLVALGVMWQDGDNDGFPDDIEMMMGFMPNDPRSNPGTRPRANAPIGVFTGKFQMGGNLNSITFKLSLDSARKLNVAYTAYLGLDTLQDTVKCMFMEMSGEVLIPVALPKNGPDAGRALLLRGHYDAIQSLFNGPIDMIQAPEEGSAEFGGGPYVGQFAASGRGEDVSRYLPGAMGGMPAGPVPMGGPMYGPMPGGPMPTMGYRMPPAGTSEGSKIIVSKGRLVLIDDFEDTLAVIGDINVRSQPDGSFEYFGEWRSSAVNLHERKEVGGRIQYSGSEWIFDGHFMYDRDSAGNHRGIPGQFCAKAKKEAVKALEGAPGVEGVFSGWIAQDKFGGGFSGPSLPICPTPTATGCQMPPSGPMDTGIPGCYPGMPCDATNGAQTGPNTGSPGTMPIPVMNSYTHPFMGGTPRFHDFASRDTGYAKEGWFYVSLSGRIYRVKYDADHVLDSKSPMCGMVVFKPELIPLKDGAGDMEKNGFAIDSMSLTGHAKGSIVVLIEDQFHPGMPARVDKARDAQGNIRVLPLMAEMRPIPYDYGSSTMPCPVMDAMTGPGPGTPPNGGYQPPTVAPGYIPPATGPGYVPPATGPVYQPPAGVPVPYGATIRFQGLIDDAKRATSGTGSMAWLAKDSMGTLILVEKVSVEATSIRFDSLATTILVKVMSRQSNVFTFLADGSPSKLMVRDGLPVVHDVGYFKSYPPPASGPIYTPPTTAYPPPVVGTAPTYDSTKAGTYPPLPTGGYTPPAGGTAPAYDSSKAGTYTPPVSGGTPLPGAPSSFYQPGEIFTFVLIGVNGPVTSTLTVTSATTHGNIAMAITSFLRGAGAGLGTSADVVTTADMAAAPGNLLTIYGNTMAIYGFQITRTLNGLVVYSAFPEPINIPAGITRLTQKVYL